MHRYLRVHVYSSVFNIVCTDTNAYMYRINMHKPARMYRCTYIQYTSRQKVVYLYICTQLYALINLPWVKGGFLRRVLGNTPWSLCASICWKLLYLHMYHMFISIYVYKPIHIYTYSYTYIHTYTHFFGVHMHFLKHFECHAFRHASA